MMAHPLATIPFQSAAIRISLSGTSSAQIFGCVCVCAHKNDSLFVLILEYVSGVISLGGINRGGRLAEVSSMAKHLWMGKKQGGTILHPQNTTLHHLQLY